MMDPPPLSASQQQSSQVQQIQQQILQQPLLQQQQMQAAQQPGAAPGGGGGQQQQQDAIYTAVYSGISVYEMICRNVAVMRRKGDSYLNATQILKVAGIDKGRRTKILEKEVQIGEHEKVQGGYGKYQGTW